MIRMMLVGFAMLLGAGGIAAAQEEKPVETRQRVVIVVGAEGTPEFGASFRQWAERWAAAGKQAGAVCQTIGLDKEDKEGEKSDREQLDTFLTSEGTGPLWIVLIGHGTFDGKTARFNLRGPDISSAELAKLLQKIESPVAVVNCTSCSGPFLLDLSAKQRVVITATKSGHEYNFARFGEYMSTAITEPTADLDKDEQTSLLEAYLVASAKLREFYAQESRLATEHALIDDNGDKLGTPADWFQGLRATKEAKAGAALDGTLAKQFILVRSAREEKIPADVRARRDELERKLAELRQQKAKLPEAEYLAALEPILVELAKLGQQTTTPPTPAARSK